MKKVRKISILSIIVFICSVFWLMPLLLIFINSFKPYNDMLQEFLALPKSWSLNMYIETWTKFDFPLLIGNIFQQLYNTADSVIAGNFISKQALAAIGSSNSLINLLIGLFLGIATGAVLS